MSAITADSKPGMKAPAGRKETGSLAGIRERRSNPRCPFTAGVTAVEPLSQTDLVAHTTDLSRGGCYVDTMNPFPTGTEMHLRLTKNGTSFHAKARVAYCQAGVGMGLVFTEVAPAQRPILGRWLANLRGESVPDLTVIEMEKDDESFVAPGSKTGERYVIEDLVALLIQKHLLTEDEGRTILQRLSE